MQHNLEKAESGGNTLILQKLALLPNDTLLNEGGLAECFEVSIKTVKRMEDKGDIPYHFKLGGKNCWFVGDVIEYLHQRARQALEFAIAEQKRLGNYRPF